MVRNCLICQKELKEFSVSPIAKAGPQKYCSIQCTGLAQKKKPLEFECPVCEKLFFIKSPQRSYISRLQKLDPSYKPCCSRECGGKRGNQTKLKNGIAEIISAPCKHCKQEFSFSARELMRQYCSKRCHSEHVSVKAEKIHCESCGEVFYKKKYKGYILSKYKFCSRHCALKAGSVAGQLARKRLNP